MADWKGYFDRKGSPKLKVRVIIPPSRSGEFEALVDMGFNGFLSLPFSALPIFKNQIDDLKSVTFADGTRTLRLEVKATVIVEDQHITGRAVIEPDGNDVIVGMQFLQASNRGLVLFPAKNEVSLPIDILH
jgi:predicted aspartyl protease